MGNLVLCKQKERVRVAVDKKGEKREKNPTWPLTPDRRERMKKESI